MAKNSFLTRIRNAVTGRFTTKAEAEANPRETVTETYVSPVYTLAMGVIGERIPGAVHEAALGAHKPVGDYVRSLRSGNLTTADFITDLKAGLKIAEREDELEKLKDLRELQPNTSGAQPLNREYLRGNTGVTDTLNAALFAAGVRPKDGSIEEVSNFIQSRLAWCGWIIVKEGQGDA